MKGAFGEMFYGEVPWYPIGPSSSVSAAPGCMVEDEALTRRMLSRLNRVFDREEHRFLALRLNYDGQMTWTVKDEILTTSVVGGSGKNLSITLSCFTLRDLAAYLATQPGYTVPFVDLSRGSVNCLALLDGVSSLNQSNGDHLYAYESIVWSYLSGLSEVLRRARTNIAEMLKQMVLWTAEGEWISEWGEWFAVPRFRGEADASYRFRILEEVLRIKSNNRALEEIVERVTGLSVSVIDIDWRGDDNLLFTNRINRTLNKRADLTFANILWDGGLTVWDGGSTVWNDMIVTADAKNSWVAGPEFFSSGQERLTELFGLIKFAPGAFPFGGAPLYGDPANNNPLVAAFAVVIHADNVGGIDPLVLLALKTVIDRYRAAGTIAVFFGIRATLLRTNMPAEILNSADYLSGPRSGRYTQITI